MLLPAFFSFLFYLGIISGWGTTDVEIKVPLGKKRIAVKSLIFKPEAGQTMVNKKITGETRFVSLGYVIFRQLAKIIICKKSIFQAKVCNSLMRVHACAHPPTHPHTHTHTHAQARVHTHALAQADRQTHTTQSTLSLIHI